MCLAVPGKLVEVTNPTQGSGFGPVGKVDFQGSQIEIGLAFTPEAKVGDWVLVHAGFAISLLDEADARETWKYLEEAQVAEMPAELKERSETTAGPSAHGTQS